MTRVKSGKVLIVDDDEDILLAARIFLRKHFQTVSTLAKPAQLPQVLAEESYDVVLLDMNFEQDATSGNEGFHWLGRIRELAPSVRVIMTTAYGDVDKAVVSIKQGAADFILKPWQNEKLRLTLASHVDLGQSRRELVAMRGKQAVFQQVMDQPFKDIIGDSQAMQHIFAIITKAAATSANILILGENGTGKELVARALHRHSKRAAEAFITVDMGTVNENLFESELFGHKRGAFTDAKADRIGRFQAASGGTLFFDEVGNLPLALQTKLLSTLQNRTVTPVGSDKGVPVDIRLISATNADIHGLVAKKQFRQDLLYRLNTIEINMPPLRERQEDIVPLAEHFLTQYRRKYQVGTKIISASAMKRLQQYPWPGNVRELQHALERAVILSDGECLSPRDFFPGGPAGEGPEDSLSIVNFNLEKVEKAVIEKVIEKHRGNISRAAKELGLTRTSLYRRIQRYGVY